MTGRWDCGYVVFLTPNDLVNFDGDLINFRHNHIDGGRIDGTLLFLYLSKEDYRIISAEQKYVESEGTMYSFFLVL